MALNPEKRRSLAKRICAAKLSAKSPARRKQRAGFALPARTPFNATEQLTEQQRVELAAAKRRVEVALSKPSLSVEALRLRARSAAKWESANGNPTVFAGPSR